MDTNKQTYQSQSVVNWYKKMQALEPVEQKVFDIHADLIKNAGLLDIGIGGGRTTGHLVSRCKNYIGIDYSEVFVNSVGKQFPALDCRVMDARDLSAFKNESFEVVNFSFNGIDYVHLEGRQKILSEIFRVLKQDGLFFFSTHNKNHASFNVQPWMDDGSALLTRIKDLIKLLPFFIRKLRNKKNETIQTNYAIINDSAHEYRLLTFYTSPEFLNTQLINTGFETIKYFSRSGREVNNQETEDWIFVTARKAKI